MSALWALLIGIDDYLPDRLPDGTRYPGLQGPTRDVARMALLLRDRYGLQPARTRMLLSRAGEDGRPAQPPERRPTYANMVAAFTQMAVEAQPGDRVYIHYSGHGARTPTQFREVKGAHGQDEALVPSDIGDPASRYLRDLELAVLVRLLVDRGLLVTVVLDCCHAGGAMRGGAWKAVPRKVFRVRPDPVPSAVAEPAVLAEVWRRLQGQQRPVRGLTLQSGLPVADYVLFAACRPDELAFEYPFEPGEPQGALTYWLLHTLARSDDGMTCGEIHQRLVARVRGKLVYQTPVFLGPGGRGFLSEETRRVRETDPLASPTALRVDEDGRVLIGVGRATGAHVGDRFRVPQGEGEVEVEVRKIGATESWAEVNHLLGPGEIEPGSRAEVLQLRATIRLQPHPALDRVRAVLRLRRGGFLEDQGEDEEGTPDLCVTAGPDEAGREVYEILDPAGVPFPNLRPLSVDAPGAALELVRRLDHLARFRNILSVENPHPADWLGIGLGLQEGGASSEPASRALDLRTGESLTLRLVNRSNLRLDFTVLNLAPDYSVTQLLPNPGSIDLLSLDPGEAYPLSLKGWLPEGYNEGNDILKIFATLGAVSFRWLELPALEKRVPVSHPRTGPKNPLEHL
ncbi:MAG TPA: caspase family protein, partial [Thermoanaerobaculia bacterium]|nr:caspase family protein [Thermoanaerobaculia bacterium]